MGYCPQNDALDPHLTVREQLEVQCRLRGIPSKNISNVSFFILKQFKLFHFKTIKVISFPIKTFAAMIVLMIHIFYAFW